MRILRDEFKLNHPYLGWYQIRNTLKARNMIRDFTPVGFTEFEAAYKVLGDVLRPQVYTISFLKVKLLYV